MKKSTIVGVIVSGYFGCIVSGLFNVTILDWQWWVTVMPVILGYIIEKNIYADEEN